MKTGNLIDISPTNLIHIQVFVAKDKEGKKWAWQEECVYPFPKIMDEVDIPKIAIEIDFNRKF